MEVFGDFVVAESNDVVSAVEFLQLGEQLGAHLPKRPSDEYLLTHYPKIIKNTISLAF